MAWLTVRLTPRAGRDAVDGVDEEGRLRVRVAAPPVGGAANEALVRLLAADLSVPRSAVTITAGGTARVKRVTVAGDAVVVRVRLEERWPGVRVAD